MKVHASTVTRTDCGHRAAEPFFSRVFTGLLRPRRAIVGMELAGEVEAVGATVKEFAVGDRVFGVRSGANAEFVCVREQGALAHMPDGPVVRGGSGGQRRSDHRARVPAQGRPARGRRILDLRRVGSHRNGGGAAGEALRRPRHRRVQHEERRARALARGRRGRRLPPGGLHEERQDVRRRSSTRSASTRSGAVDFRSSRAGSTSRPTSASCGTSRRSRC